MFVASHALSSALVCTCAGMSPSISASSSGVFPSAASSPSFFVGTTCFIPKSRATRGPPRLGDLFEIERFTNTAALRFETHRVNDLVPFFPRFRHGLLLDGLFESLMWNECDEQVTVARVCRLFEG